MNYRKIYESHYGPIPKEYEIHHIDGDNSNNVIQNLKCVSINEHYDIHYDQKDYGACSAIAIRMQTPKHVLSELISLAQKQRFSRLEEREAVRKRTYEQFSDPVKRMSHKLACNGHKDKIWINNGSENKRVPESDLCQYEGWVRGRLISKQNIEKMINNRTSTRDNKTGRFVKKGE